MQSNETRARFVLERMREATPPTAKKPWRTQRSIALIQHWLDEGATVDELLEHVAGAARLVAAGREAARWWTAGNLFGHRTIERWQGEIAAHEAELQQRQRQVEQAQARAVVGGDNVVELRPIEDVQPELREHFAKWRVVTKRTGEQLGLFDDGQDDKKR